MVCFYWDLTLLMAGTSNDKAIRTHPSHYTPLVGVVSSLWGGSKIRSGPVEKLIDINRIRTIDTLPVSTTTKLSFDVWMTI